MLPLVAAAITIAGFHGKLQGDSLICYVGTHHISCASTGVVFVIIQRYVQTWTWQLQRLCTDFFVQT